MLNQPAKEKSVENNEVPKYFQDDTDKLAEEKEQDIDDKINEQKYIATFMWLYISGRYRCELRCVYKK